jgi:hypothetical protein
VSLSSLEAALWSVRLIVVDVQSRQLIERGYIVDLAKQPVTHYSAAFSESPISQNIGGHRPTNSARRSALPRSSWSTVLARIHKPMHKPIEATEVA